MKPRLDQQMVALGLAESRSKAQALIMAGHVLVAGKNVTKAGTPVTEHAEITLKGERCPWVSRGGYKLAAAMDAFALNSEEKICLDVGASTGGFTDVLLQAGAKRVYAVDVGHGQLDWSLRNDARVQVLEKTNARHLTAEHIPQAPEWIVCDASFIPLQTVLPAALSLAAPGATLIALIKPQFQAEKKEVSKGKGVITDTAIHQRVCEQVMQWLSSQTGWQIRGLAPSPITGPKGNHEFLLWATKNTGLLPMPLLYAQS